MIDTIAAILLTVAILVTNVAGGGRTVREPAPPQVLGAGSSSESGLVSKLIDSIKGFFSPPPVEPTINSATDDIEISGIPREAILSIEGPAGSGTAINIWNDATAARIATVRGSNSDIRISPDGGQVFVSGDLAVSSLLAGMSYKGQIWGRSLILNGQKLDGKTFSVINSAGKDIFTINADDESVTINAPVNITGPVNAPNIITEAGDEIPPELLAHLTDTSNPHKTTAAQVGALPLSGGTVVGNTVFNANLTVNGTLSATNLSGNGSGITNIQDSALSPNVALLNRPTQTFSGTNIFSAAGTALIVTNTASIGTLDVVGQIEAGSANIIITTPTGNIDADAIGLITADGVGATSSGSGLEVDSDRLGLLQGCADGQILKWNDLAAVWACSADLAGGGGATLQGAYDAGNSITTTDSRDINFILSDTTVDSNFDIDIVADNFVSISRLDNAVTESPPQLLLIENLDTNLTIADGISIQVATGGVITDGIDLSDSDIVNAINIGQNNILSDGVTISSSELNLLDGHDVALIDINDAVNTAITGTGALGSGSITAGFGAIDTGADNITTTGTVTGGIVNATTALQTGGIARIDSSGNLVSIGNLSALAAITISSTGAGNDIILNSADTIELLDNTNITGNLDVSGTLVAGTGDAFQVDAAGNVISGTINGQTISSAASFTGTLAVTTLGSAGSTSLCRNGSNQLATCTSNPDGVTLQQAYDAGNTITTTDNRNIAITLADTTTDSNLTIDLAADNTVTISRLNNASTEAPAQLLLLTNLDTDLTVADGLLIQAAGAARLTDAIDVSDADIVNALNVGDNVILGTTAVIDFTNFDVSGAGAITAASLNAGSGTIQTTGTIQGGTLNATTALQTGGTTRIDASGNLTNIGTISSGAITTTGTLTFSGVATDITTASGEDLTLVAAGTGVIVLNDTVQIPTLGSAGSTSLCRNGSNQLATCTSNPDSVTLQQAYDAGNTITTTDNRNIAITLADTTTDSSLTIDLAADNTVTISRLNNASTEAPAQLLLLTNLDTDLTVADGLLIQAAGAARLTDAIDVSDADIVNALNVGDNVILGTTAVIDFTNFDVSGAGAITAASLNAGSGTIQTTGTIQGGTLNATTALQTGGTTRIDASGNLTNIGTISSGAITTTGTLTFSGVATDITTASGEDLTLVAAGTGVIVLNDTVQIPTLGSAGSTSLCRNGSNQLATCTSNPDSVTLQQAYDAGNTITTTDNRNIAITLADTTTDSSLTIDLAADNTVTISRLNNASTEAPAQLLLLTNLDTDLTVADGLLIQAAGAARLTDAIDVSDADIVNALNVGDNVILGTTAVIDFTNFDVSGAGAITAVGVNAGTGLLQGTGGFTMTGAVNINTSGANATNIGTGTNTGTITIGNASGGDLVLADPNWSVTGAGAATFASVNAGSGTIQTTGSLQGGTITATTSVTSPSYTGTGAVSVSSGGSAALTLDSASGVVLIASGDDLQIGGNDILDSGGTIRLTLGASGTYTGNFNVTGNLTQGGTAVCLSNGTNCPADSTTLQSAYNTGNTITTTDNRNIAITLADTTTDSSLTIDLAADNTVTISRLNNASTEAPAQLLLLTNLDTDLTVADGLLIQAAGAARLTDAIDVSDADIVNALNVGDNVILGTTAVIDFTNFDVSGAGAVTAGSTITGTTLNASTGTIQTAGTNRIDNTGNLVNIGNITGTGAITIASTGAGNDVIIDGADQFIVQDAAVLNSTATFNGLATFNTDIDIVFVDTENIALTSTITGTNSVDLFAAVLTNQTTSGTQRGIVLTNANDAANAVTEALIVLDNAETTASTLTDALRITSSGVAGGVVDAIDVSDANIVNALNVGDNVILGTTAVIDFTNFDVSGAGAITAASLNAGSGTIQTTGTIQGGTLNATTALQTGGTTRIDASGNLTNIGTISSGAITTTGTLTFSGVATDITTASGEDLTLVAAGTGVIVLNDTVQIPTLGSAGSTSLCRNGSNQLATCTSNPDSVTLQQAYDAGNTITTTDNRNIAITLADTTTDSSLTIDLAADNTVTISRLNNASTEAPAQLLLLTNLDTDLTVADGLLIQAAGAARLTDAIDVSDADIVNALNVGDNVILGTTAVIDFTNFDVAGDGSFTFNNNSSSNSIINLASTGDFVIQDAGSPLLTITDSGAFTYALPSGTVDFTISGLDTDSNLILSGLNCSSFLNGGTLTTDSSGVVVCADDDAGGGGGTLQQAYDNGNTITTTNARDIDITLADTTTDSNLDIVIATNSTSTVSITRAAGAGTSNPAQLLLIEDLDADLTIADGLTIRTAGVLTDAIDLSDAEIVNALNIGANTILGTTAVIDFTNFDVSGAGAITAASLNAGSGTIQTTGTIQGGTLNATTALQTGGTTRIDASGNLTNIGTISSGAITTTGTLTFSGVATDITTASGEDLTLVAAGTGVIVLNDTVQIPTLGSAGSTSLCRNGSNQLATCTSNPDGVTLQQAYDAGNTITTTDNRNIAITLADTTTDSSLTIDLAADNTVTISRLNNASTEAPAQLLLLTNLDTDLTVADGLLIQAAGAARLTDAIDVSDADIVNAINVGDNVILGTTAVIDFTNFDVSGAGAVTAGSTITGTTLNASTGTIQTAGTNRIDNTGNLVNIGNITGTGAITIASTGGGNDVIIDGADQFIVQDAAVLNSTATFNGLATFNTDIDIVFVDTENIALTSTITGTNSVDLFAAVLTNQTTSGTQRGIVLTNANDAANAVTEALIVLDNAETTASTLTDALRITSSGVAGGVVDAIDVSDANIVNALNVGDNVILGTTAVIDFTNFDVSGAGAITAASLNAGSGTIQTTGTIQGGTLNATTALQTGGTTRIDASGNLTNIGTISSGAITTTGTLTFSGVATDITTASGEDLTLVAAGTGVIVLNDTVQIPTLGSAGSTSLCRNASNQLATCSANPDGVTLQQAYDAGNTITTTDNRNIAITLADTTTDSSLTIDLAADNTVTISRLNNASTEAPAQLLLLTNLDTDLTVADGLLIQAAGAARLTDAIDVSDADIVNALNVGDNVILGTTAVIDFTNFDVAGDGSFTFNNNSSSNSIINLASTGDFVIQDAGSPLLTITDSGAFTYALPSGTVDFTISGLDTDSNLILSGLNCSSFLNGGTLTTDSSGVVVCADDDAGGGGGTLQQAYDNGNTITTTNARDIDITLADTTTDSNLDIVIATNSTSTVSITRAAGAGTSNPAQLLLIEDLDADLTIADGLTIRTAGVLTDAIDLSDAEIVNALNIGANTILGTTAVIDFTNFDVSGAGAITAASLNAGSGTIQTTGTIQGGTLNATTALQTGGTTRIDASGNLTNIGTISSGAITTTGTLTFSGVATDITTASGEDLTLVAAGTGVIVLNDTVQIPTLGSAGSTSLCRNGSNQLATCTSNPDGVTLQQAYDAGNTITTTDNRNIAITLADTTTDSSLTIDLAADNTVTISRLNNASTEAPAQLLLLTNLDTDLTVADGLLIQAAGAARLTDAIDVSDADIVNAINVGDNVILGTTAVIDFTNFDVSGAGAVTAGSTITGTTLNASTGTIQTAGTNRIDNTGNLVNIGNITGTGAITIASTGGGNDVIIDGADQFIVQDAAVLNSTATFNGLATFNTDIDIVFVDTENIALTSTITGTNSVDLFAAVLTNQTTSGTQRGIVLTNANDAANAVTEALIVLDNAETTASTLTDALRITSSGVAGGVVDAIDVSDANIVNALNVGDNVILGTTAVIDFTNFDVSGAGAITAASLNAGSGTIQTTGTIQGGTLNATTALQTGGTTRIDASGNLTNIGTISSGAITTTGTLTFSGVATDITTASGEDLTLVAAGTGVIVLNDTVQIPTLGSAGSTSLCRNGSNQLATCTSNPDSVTLQQAYDAGNTITTTDNRNIAITLADTTTDSSLTIDLAADNTVTISRLNNASTEAPAQLLLLTNLDTDLTVADGLLIQAAGAARLTDAIDVSDADIVNALNVGDNVILGTTAVIDFTNFDVSGAGAVTAGSTITGTTLNASTGTIQTAGTNRIDNTGNLVNIGNITGTGAITIASTGGGNDVVIDGADQFIVQDAAVLNSTATFNGLATFNTDIDIVFVDTENIALTSTITGTNSVDLFAAVLTNQTTSGTQRGIVLTNANDAANAVTEALIVLDNAETTASTLTDALRITSSGVAGGVVDAIDVSDANIVNALNVGDNVILGTTAVIDFTNFDVSGAGAITAASLNAGSGTIQTTGTIQGGTLNATTALQTGGTTRIDASGNLTNIGTISSGAITTTGTLTFSGVATDITTASGEDLTLVAAGTGVIVLNDTVQIPTLGSAGSTSLCRNASNQLATCSANPDGVTLQQAYDAGNTITTTDNRNIAITLADTTTDSSLTIDLAADNTVTISRLNNASTEAPAQLLLLTNLDTDLTVADGLLIQAAGAARLTDAIDVSDADIVNALNVGDNVILGTTAVIDFTNFDVAGDGSFTFNNNSSSNSIINLASTGDFVIQDAGSPLLTITDSGAFTYALPSGTVDFTISGLDTDSNLILSGLNCSSFLNGGTLTTDSSGVVVCADDDAGGGGGTLQQAYDNGNTITTTNARDIDITLADTTTDSNLDIVIATNSTSTVSITRAAGAGTSNPAQLLLIEDLDADLTIADGLTIRTAGVLTDAIDLSDAEIVNALNIGANTILGTTAVIDFTNFDVSGAGAITAASLNAGSGTIQTTGTIQGGTLNATTALQTGGTTRIDASGNLTNIGTISSGAITTTGTLTFSGVATDITTASGEDLTLVAAGTGVIVLNDTVQIPTLGSAGSTSLCRNGSNQLATCTSNPDGVTLQQAYDAGNTITTTDNRNIAITLADTTTDSDFIIDMLGTGNTIEFRDSGTAFFTASDGGAILFKPTTNSTTAFQVQPAASTTPVFNVDTTNSRIGVNTNAPTEAFQVHRGVILGTSGGTTEQLTGLAPDVDVRAITVAGQYAYVGTATITGTTCPANCEFKIVDISKPGAPVVVGGLEIGAGVNAIAVAGRYAYLGNDDISSGDFMIVDISNPASPTSVGTFHMGASGQRVRGVAVSGKYAYVVKDAVGVSGQFFVIDISNPASPSSVFSTGGTGGSPHYLTITVSGKYVYIGSATNSSTCPSFNNGCEFQIWDISNPASPSFVSGIDTAISVNSLYPSGRYVYAVTDNVAGSSCASQCEFKIFDVSNPSSPTTTGSLDLGGGNGNRVFVAGTYAYVAKGNSGLTNDFVIIDVATPASPTEVGGADLGADGLTVTTAGKFGFVGNAAVSGTCSGSTVTGCEFRVIDLPGLDVPTANLGAAAANFLQVSERADFGQINVSTGVNVGTGGIQSQGPVSIMANSTGSSAYPLQVRNSAGTETFSVRDDGVTLFKPSTNSTTAFQVQPAASTTPAFNVDTTNSRIGVGIADPDTTIMAAGTGVTQAGFTTHLELFDVSAPAANEGPGIAFTGCHTGSGTGCSQGVYAGILGAKENATTGNVQGYLVLGTRPSSGNLAQALRIDSAQNVLVGSGASIAARLEVANTGTAPYTTTGLLLQSTFTPSSGGTQNNARIITTNSATSTANTTRGLEITTIDTTSLANTNIGLYIDPSTANSADTEIAAILGGRTSVGTTSNPSAILHVSSAASFPLFRVTDATSSAVDVMNIADEGAVTFRNRTNSTSAFLIQNAGATNEIVRVDATNSRVKIGTGTSAPGYTLDVQGGDINVSGVYRQGGTNVGQTATCSAGNTFSGLTVSGGIVTAVGSCTAIGGGSTTLQQAYDAGNTITTTDNRNIVFTLADTTTDSDFIVDMLGTGNTIEFRDGGTAFATFSDTGTVLFKPTTNSTTAFQVQPSASATPVLNVDTTNSRVGIGTAAPSADLTFGETADRTINILTRTTNAAGNNLTIQAGTAGAGASAFAGGSLSLQGGNAAGTGNAAGGSVYLFGGTGVGTGLAGDVVLAHTGSAARGNVAIGASSADNLDGWERMLYIAGTNEANLTVHSLAGNNRGYVAMDNSNWTDTPAGMKIGTRSDTSLGFFTSSTNALNIDTSQRVGIGFGLSAIGAKLDVLNTGTAPYTTTGLRLQSTFSPSAGGTQFNQQIITTNAPTVAANTTRGLEITTIDTTSLANTNIGLYIDPSTANSADTEIAAILGGRTSVGTTSNPSAILHVSSAASFPLFRVTDATSSAVDVMNIADEGAVTFRNRTNSTSAFLIQNAGATNEIVRVDATNSRVKIGTGTSAPGYTLDVQGGDINVSGVYRQGGTNVGQTATCSAGNTFSGLTVSGGIVTAVGSCTAIGGGSGTLQDAYDAGNTITTTNARDIDITLADTTTDSNLDIVIATNSTSTVSITRAAGAGTSNPAQLLLLEDLDADLTIADGLIIRTAGVLTDAIDLSDAEIVNALNIGANTLLGGAAIIDFTNFDVSSAGTVTIAAGQSYTGAGAVTLSSGSGTALTITGNAASTWSTSSGALTITSAAAATWSTSAGNLTIQAGSGTVSLGTSTALTAAGALTVSSGGSSALTLDSASNTLVIAATDTTLQRTASGTFTIDLVNAANTVLFIENSGAGVANLRVSGLVSCDTIDTDASGNLVCGTDAGAGASPFASSGGVITKSTSTDQLRLTMAEAGDYGLLVDTSTAPTVDLVQIETTNAVASASADALQITYRQGANAANITGSALDIAIAAQSGESGDTIRGITIQGITGGSAVEQALAFGGGWDVDITTLNDTDLNIAPGGTGSIIINLPSTGDFIIQDAGTAAFLVGDGGETQIAMAFQLTGDITPATITADQNDYNPSGLATATVLRLSVDQRRVITGLAGGADGRIITIVNVSGSHDGDIVLRNESSSSTAANRFAFGEDVVLEDGDNVTLIYDSIASRWRRLADESTSELDKRLFRIFEYNDLLGSAGADTKEASEAWNLVLTGSATQSKVAGVANHPGIHRTTSSTTNPSGSSWVADPAAILIAGGEFFECVFRIPTLTSTTVRIGLIDQTGTADAVDGAYIEIPSTGEAVLKTAAASTRTTSATIATLSANTWYRARVIVAPGAGSVTGYIFDEGGNLLGSQTNTTNIPTAAGQQTSFGVQAVNASTTSGLNILENDYMAFGILRALSR